MKNTTLSSISLMTFLFFLPIISFSQDVDCTESNIGCMDEIACDYNPNALCPGECNYDCYGCLDPEACNYNPNATLSYNYCAYTDLGCGCGFPAAEPGYDCYGNCIVDEDGDGICDEIYGCTDPIAPNYVQEANIDNESCEEVIYGCINPFAENFDESANTSDGSCELIGCMSEGALNYSEAATIDNGDCVWLEPVVENTCNGRYLDKIFPEVEVETVTYSDIYGLQLDIYTGVGDTIVEDRPLIVYIHGGAFISEFGDRTGPQATYVATEMAQRGYVVASIDYRKASLFQILCGGLCDQGFGDITPWAPWQYWDYIGDHIGKAFSDSKAAIRYFRKSVAENNPYRIDPNHIYVGGHSAGGIISNHIILESNEDINPSHPIYDYIMDNGGYFGDSGNFGFSHDVAGGFPLASAIFPTDFSNITEDDFDKLYISVHGEADNIVPYGFGQIIPIVSFPFSGLIFPNCQGSGAMSNYMDDIGMENHHLSFQGDPWFTAGHNFEQWGPNGQEAMITFVTTHLFNNLPCSAGDIGCTDETACNYSPSAINDDGSCSQISGCTDPTACNFNVNAGCDDGSCIGLAGCMDANAFNYNEIATCQLSNACIEIIEGCTYLYANNYSEIANTDDGSCQIEGCTDSSASNYNPEATDDNGSCYFTPDCIQITTEFISECGSYTWFEEDIDTTGLYSPSFLSPISPDYGGFDVDMSNPSSLLVGKPEENNNDGLISMYIRNGDEWIQKGDDLLGQGLDNSEIGDQFGSSVAMGDVNTIATSSPNSDYMYTVCGNPYWTINCEWSCPAWPFWCPGLICFPSFQQDCDNIYQNNKGIVNVYSWVNNQWELKGETIWGEFEEDFSGNEIDMADSNTIAIGSSNTGLTESGFIGNLKVFSFQENGWVQKGENFYGEEGGDEVGKGFSMGDKNTIAISYKNQNKVKVFEWNGNDWLQKGPPIIVGNLSQSVSMFNNSSLAISGDSQTEVYDWNGTYWVIKGSPILFSGGESVSMGGPNTISVTSSESIALFRFENEEWLLKTQTYNNPGTVVMGNPNILAIPGQVFEYIPEVNEDGCQEFTMINLTIDDPATSGCTNPLACNYDETAICDDGSCSEISGCTEPTACNYNPNAGCDDGSCSEVSGCTDPNACNYNPDAGCDDNTCYNNDLGCGCDQPAAEPGYDCFGNCLTDSDGDGICDEFEILGCLDVNACNYDSSPTTDEDNSLCNYLDGICDTCLNGIIIDNDADNDGVCDDDEVLGCTDNNACNYNELATENDNTCYNNDLGCGCDQPAAEPGYDCFGNCLTDTDGDGICDEFEILGCLDVNACNFDSNPTTDEDNSLCNYLDGICDTCVNGIIIDNDADNDGVCDDDEVLGCTDDSACNYNELATNGYDDWYLPSYDELYLMYQTIGQGSDNIAQFGNGWYWSSTYGYGNPESGINVVVNMSNGNTYGQGFYNSDIVNVRPIRSFNTNSTTLPNIGDFYEGGIVFEINDDGTGLVANLSDLESSNYSTAIDNISNYTAENDVICDYESCVGCMDTNACNYDETFTQANNLECNYLDGICDTCVNGIIIDNDADNDGVCDDDEVLGCTDNSACNYNELATENDNTCNYLEPYLESIDNIDSTIENCDLFSDQVSNPEDWPYAFVATGPWQPNSNLAQNFVININSLPPGGANYRVVKTVANGNWDVGPTTPLNLGFNYMNVEEVDYERIVRFTFSSGEIGFDSIFLNDIEQNCNIYLYDCDNNCFNDLDGDGICDELEITGCTDSAACNYDNTATDDDGSCLLGYQSFTLVLYDSYGDGWAANNGLTHTLSINGSIYGNDFTDGTIASYIGGDQLSYEICLNTQECNIFNFSDNGQYENECSWELYDENSTLVLNSGPSILTNQYLGDLCFGCTSPIACNYDSNALVNDINEPCIFPNFGYDCNNNCINDSDGDGVCNVFEIVGCQDQIACNYNPEATDQGPCTYTDGICEDCVDGIIIDNDLDNDGVCNNDEIPGCQDLNACNYNPDATDEANCIYLDGICDSCFNNIIIDNDADNDGVCDNDEVAGCQDLSACNYNPVATDDDNSCFYPAEQYLDCYGNCINDSDGDGICNELEILGCTDTNACNYDFNSTENDGSCTYSFVGLDCFGNCINDLDNDGVCDENEILGCTNPSAVNFNNLATEDNNSCDFGPFGEITETDCIMTIVFSEDFSLSYGNQIFSEGWIGVTDADGNIYGSTFWLEGQNNSIMAYGSNINNEGIEYNEELNWIFSFNNNNIIMSPVYGFADGIFSCSDLAIIESLSSDLPGCLDSEAFNFNNLANIDDNSCDYGPWDEIPNTDCNMTILIPGNANISIDGEQILDAWIGLSDSDGNICGSTYWTYGETGAIAAWGEDDGTFGFEVGETINWIISTPEGDLFGNASLSFGSNEYACNALAGINSIDFGLQNYTQEIELYTGWNMWSTYIEPQNNNIENLFSGVSNNLLIVKDENGSVYWPLFGLNTIGDLTKGKGYQTKMSNDDVLIVEGSLIPSNYSFNIPIGWSIIGYLHTTCYNASDMMSPLANQIIILKDESGLVFWPTFGLNTIGDMCPDKGYQIKMLEESVFNYPSYSRFGYSDIDIIDKTVYYDEAKNTGNNMIIGLPIESWNTLPKIGDEIAAYDNVGNLVGSTTFNGDHIALTVWGNDATTNVKDGLHQNEELVFRVWSSDQNEEYSMRITNWQSGSNIYITDNINIASNIVIDKANKNDFSILFQNSPNPFSESTKIEFFVPKTCLVNFTLHNIMGEKIKTISNSEFESGNHEIIFRPDNLSPGTYFINMQTKNYTKTLKINLTK